MSEEQTPIISKRCIDFIKKWEALVLHAYYDSGGVLTIGWGTIMHPDGTKVKEGETCTIEQAEMWLTWEVTNKANAVKHLLGAYPCTQNQLEALVSFAYNVGIGAFAGSTLLRKFKINPFDETIHEEFKKWSKCDGKFVQGLLNRRIAEAKYYSENIKQAINRIIKEASKKITALSFTDPESEQIKAIAQTGLESAIASINVIHP